MILRPEKQTTLSGSQSLKIQNGMRSSFGRNASLGSSFAGTQNLIVGSWYPLSRQVQTAFLNLSDACCV
ncbi:MAG: hypothetical protein JWP08_3449 [Bryobacterales bacterium]|jgi:hypothetical protein|nr:hypothetical protein [Bryobacterales bacterium]